MSTSDNNSQNQKTTREKYKSLPKRVQTSCIFLSLLALIIYLDLTQFKFPWSISFAAAILSGFIVYEYYQMAIKSNQLPFLKTGILFTVLIFVSRPIEEILTLNQIHISSFHLQLWLIVFATIVCFALQAKKPVCEKAFEGIASTLSGILYVGLLGSFLMQIAWLEHDPILSQKISGNIKGIHLLGFSILVIKMTDIGAFMIGVAFGKHKWIPRISPGKSIEGLIGGVLSATLLAFLLNQYCWHIFNHLWKPIAYGLLMAYVGQLSDLIESVFKRCANMKDSGTYLPGFGGFFDLTDSLIASAPISYLLFVVFYYI